MQLIANLSMLFTERPLLQRVAAAREAGFDAVEIQFPYEVSPFELRRELDDNGMPLVLINLPAGDLMSGGAGWPASPNWAESLPKRWIRRWNMPP